MNKQLLSLAIQASLRAGKKILEVYDTSFEVENKSDNSPLTLADKQSHAAIEQLLGTTQYPLLSEEGKNIPYEERKHWEIFWLIDPLDGTKEFIKRNGEFTVNIALIKNGEPVMGIIYIPVSKKLFFAMEHLGSYFIQYENDGAVEVNHLIKQAQKLPLPETNNHYTIVASRSHLSKETEDFIQQKKQQYGDVECISSGSSIKLCLVAEGKAQVYPRLAPTMEWDTAAGHAIAKYAGCNVYNFETKKELSYNKENLLNPWFVVERK
jgi:3'(2'), 5'-bisphosphate nucleotidase